MTNTLVNATNLTKNAGSDFSTTGTMPVQESQLMSIDMANAAFIMESLTNLYSDPHLSVIREYVANGIDSHIEAGNDAPVEVTLPNDWSPLLVIKDQGVGMSRDDVFRYGTYGSSDKRDNLKVVGNFGMGSKSALAITNSFTITAVKDGEYTVANIGRNDEGHGQVDIITNEPTDQPNGVTISIPIAPRSFWSIKDKAEQVVKCLPAGRVSVDGVLNTDIRATLSQISDDVFVSEGVWGKTSVHGVYVTVVSGGFGYKVPYEEINRIGDTLGKDFLAVPNQMLIDVPTGSVDLTPSRESLRMTSRTRDLISQAVGAAAKASSKYYEDKLADVTDFEGLLAFVQELALNFGDPSKIADKCDTLHIPAADNLIAFTIRTGSATDEARKGFNNRDLLYRISKSPGHKVIILENDKEYSPNSLNGRVRKFLSTVSEEYSHNTPVLTLNPQFKDDPSIKEDTLYRFIDRTGIRMKASEIYAAVNEYNKANRATNYTSGGSTGVGDNAIMDLEMIDGEDFSSSLIHPTSGNMLSECSEFFDNDLPVVYILNESKSSGMDLSESTLKSVLRIISETSPDNVFNAVLIFGGNRKKKYFASRGIDTISVKEFFASAQEYLVSQKSIELYNKFNSSEAIHERVWGFFFTERKIVDIIPKAKDTLKSIERELEATLPQEVMDIMQAVGGHDGVRSILSQTIEHCGEQEVPGVVALRDALNEAPKPHNRGRMVDYQLDAALALTEAGHTDEAYAMLEMTLAVLTKKKED